MSKMPSNNLRLSRLRNCSICGRTFTKTGHLERHLRSHKNEKPFRCSICNKSFGRQDVLLRHQRDSKLHAIHNSQAKEPPTASTTSPISNTAPQSSNREPSGIPYDNTAVVASDGVIFIETLPDHSATTIATLNTTDLELSESLHDPMFSNEISLDELFTELGQTYSSWLDIDVAAVGHGSADRRTEDNGRIASTSRFSLPTSRFEELKQLWSKRSTDMHNSDVRSGTATPCAESVRFDEVYRQGLRSSLDVHQAEPQVPPAQIMSLCIGLFYSRCQAILPLIHFPTFRPSKVNSPVMLAMCAMGSLCSGSEYLSQLGMHMFLQLQKSTLNRWEKIVSSSHEAVVSLIQCTVICQVYGLLLGKPSILKVVDSFHGPPTAWARQAGMFDVRPLSGLDLSAQGDELRTVWQQWVRNEEVLRISLGLHLIDAELAKLFHHDTILRLSTNYIPQISAVKVFMAPNPTEWRDLYRSEIQYSNHASQSTTCFSLAHKTVAPIYSVFAASVCLQAIIIRIIEMQKVCTSVAETTSGENQLLDVYSRFQCSKHEDSDEIQFRIMWHSAFFYLYADVQLLEKAAGRDGVLTETEALQVHEWSTTDNAQRAYLHALHIHRQAELIDQYDELALQIPLAMFASGLVWHAYLRYGSKNGIDLRTLALSHDRFKELAEFRFDPSSLQCQTWNFNEEKYLASGPLLSLADLLQRLGHWGICRDFASILSVLVELNLES